VKEKLLSIAVILSIASILGAITIRVIEKLSGKELSGPVKLCIRGAIVVCLGIPQMHLAAGNFFLGIETGSHLVNLLTALMAIASFNTAKIAAYYPIAGTLMCLHSLDKAYFKAKS